MMSGPVAGPAGRRPVLVLVRDPGGGRAAAVAEFLANEHFSVIELDGDGRARPHRPAGHSIAPSPVVVARVADGQSAAARASELRSTSMYAGEEWVEFAGDPVVVADLDGLLRRVIGRAGAPAAARPLVRAGAGELVGATIARYEDPRFVARYARRWRADPPRRELERFLAALPGNRVLDAGCGPGHHARYLAGCGCRVVGADIATAVLACAAAEVAGVVPLVRADVRRLPFAAGRFDGAWCCAILVHYPAESLPGMLAELARVLRLGGVLAFNVSLGKLPAVGPDGRFFDSFSRRADVLDLCPAAGLSVLSARLAVSGATTLGGRRVARWLNVLARREAGR